MKRRLILFVFVMLNAGLLPGAQAQSTPVPTPVVSRVISPDIFVRGGPGRSYLPVGRLVQGDRVIPVSRNESADWVLIIYRNGFGWIRYDLASWVENVDALPIMRADSLTPSPTTSLIITATSSDFFILPTATPVGSWVQLGPDVASGYVRAGPGRTYLRLGQLLTGEVVVPVGRNADSTWIMIQFEGGFGWVARNLVRWVDELDALPVVDLLDLTPSPTFTASFTPSPTATSTSTPTPTATATVTPTVTSSPTATRRPTLTSTSTSTATVTPSPTATRQPTLTSTSTSTAIATPSPTATRQPTLTSTSTSTITATATLSPTATRQPTLTSTSTSTVTATPSLTATRQPTLTSTSTSTVMPSRTPTAVPTRISTASVAPSSTFARTATITTTYTPTATPSATSMPTHTPWPIVTNTFAPMMTATRFMAASTPSSTPSRSLTDTATAALTSTITPSLVPSPTASATATASFTLPPTEMITPTTLRPSATPVFNQVVPRATSTRFSTVTLTGTSTATNEPTDVPTQTATATRRPTLTATLTSALTLTATETTVPTVTRRPTATPSVTRLPASSTPVAGIIVPGTEDPTPPPPPSQMPPPSATALTAGSPTLAAVQSGPGAIPPEAWVGGAVLLGLLGYVGLYLRGQAQLDRYQAGFVVDRCPVCQRGRLTIEDRRDRVMGIPRPRRIVRCNDCRSVLRETGNHRWRYAIDPLEDTDLFHHYNGLTVDEQTLIDLSHRSSPSPRVSDQSAELPQFDDET